MVLVRRLYSSFSQKGVRLPGLDDLQRLSNKFKFDCTSSELVEYHEIMRGLQGAFSAVDKLPDATPDLVVPKVPRTPGFRPLDSDNPGNAWYWKCDIQDSSVSGGKLSGKTLAIKDNVCVAGVPLMNGSKVVEGYVPTEDASVVSRILAAGGRIVGKSACEDLCLSGCSHTNFKNPVLNPHSESHLTGGSSSGSGYLVSKGLVDMAIGGDQGGSIRIPSCWSGIVGLKPTFGLVPYTGAISIHPTLDHLGPMARTVKDAALLLEVIAGYDGLDDRQLYGSSFKVPEYSQQLRGDLSKYKVAVMKEGFLGMDAEVDDGVRSAAELLAKSGAEVKEVSVPLHSLAGAVYLPYLLLGLQATVVQQCGVEMGSKNYVPSSLVDALFRGFQTHSRDLSVTNKVCVLFNQHILDSYGPGAYAKTRNWIRRLSAAYDSVLSTHDILLMPTLPYRPPGMIPEDASAAKVWDTALGMVANTAVFNATGHPALSINAGFTSDKLPVGLMMVGRHFQEEKVLDLAFGFEQVRAN